MVMNQQCVLAAQKKMVNVDVGCTRESDASRKGEVILPLFSFLLRPHLEYCSGLLSTEVMDVLMVP